MESDFHALSLKNKPQKCIRKFASVSGHLRTDLRKRFHPLYVKDIQLLSLNMNVGLTVNFLLLKCKEIESHVSATPDF